MLEDPGASAMAPAPHWSDRAPTLLGGQSAGGQGQVQVWIPQKIRLWAPAIGWGGIAGWGIYAMFAQHAGACVGVLGIVCMLPALINLSRPTYLTTDEAGIGITTLIGTRSLRWSDIRAVTRNFPSQGSYASLSLRLDDSIARPGSLAVVTAVINLCGYSRSLQDHLTALIVERAGLEALDAGAGKYVRRPVEALQPAPHLLSPDR
ncbi:MAG TPA: hypothetical protein VFJ58_28805 [Armatimonadota bacterium]|nr:hypothetical protein [Armatimonadota bacterium]